MRRRRVADSTLPTSPTAPVLRHTADVVDPGMGLINRAVAWRMWRNLERSGAPPANVRIISDGNVEHPTSCVYDGHYDGLHHWRVTAPPGPVYGVVWDDLPDHAAVVVARSDPPPPRHRA